MLSASSAIFRGPSELIVGPPYSIWTDPFSKDERMSSEAALPMIGLVSCRASPAVVSIALK